LLIRILCEYTASHTTDFPLPVVGFIGRQASYTCRGSCRNECSISKESYYWSGNSG